MFFTLENLDADLQKIAKSNVTEFSVHEKKISFQKESLLRFLKKAASVIPDVCISIPVDAKIIDQEVVSACQNLFCSLDLFLYEGEGQGPDKKLFTKKAALLNKADMVFGFLMDFARSRTDSIKKFRERIDFALPLYPNHIEFRQLYSAEREEKNSATFSSQDISYARSLAFSVETFYSQGRAVPWFNCVLRPLKIAPSKFFSDFAEWQRVNNCSIKESGAGKKAFSHKEIEKMQTLFLEEKFSEKKLDYLFPVANDLVKINGAFSRLQGEGEESTVRLNFNPDDLLSPLSQNIVQFAENVCMEECSVKVFASGGDLDYKILNE